MRRLIYIIALSTLCMTSTSCITMALLATASSTDSISTNGPYLNLTIFQTLNKNEALARTNNYDVVKIESLSMVLYDGKTVSGYFTLVDTYSYMTKNGLTKTVPVYVLRSEYGKHKDYWQKLPNNR